MHILAAPRPAYVGSEKAAATERSVAVRKYVRRYSFALGT